MSDDVHGSGAARMANVLELLRIVERSLEAAGAAFPAYCTRLTISAVVDEMVFAAVSERAAAAGSARDGEAGDRSHGPTLRAVARGGRFD